MSFEISVAGEIVLAPARRGLRCRWRGEAAVFSYWADPTARRHHVRGGSPVPDPAELRVLLRPAANGGTLRDAARLEEALTRTHLADVPVVGPAALDAETVEDAAVSAELRSQELLGRGGQVRGRWRAQRAARRSAADEAGARRERVATHHDADQDDADRRWAALRANDPAAVLGVLEATFDLDDVPAAAVGCDGGTVTVVVCEPAVAALPDRRVASGRRGRQAVVDRTGPERDELALRLAASHVLTVVRRVPAAAPGIRSVRVLVVRPVPSRREAEAVYAGTFEVTDPERWEDPELDLLEVLVCAPGALLASTEGLRALDLAAEPDIARVVKEISGTLYP